MTRAGSATLADFLSIPESERFHELIDGEIMQKTSPSGEHGSTQADVTGWLHGPFGRKPPSGGPGGWWLANEVEIELGDDVCRPDVVGWRRELVPERPRGTPVGVPPHWVCEVLSPSNMRNDLVRKKHIYHRHHVDHYWILDPAEGTLAVYRWHTDGYLEVLIAERGVTVRAEPFDAIEIPISGLFGEED